MSYILEALRRAESERGRKRGVPGLHAQPVPSSSADDTSERRNKAWLWVVIGLSVGVLLPLMWRWWVSDPTAEETAARAPIAGSVSPQPRAGSADAANAAVTLVASAPTAPTVALAAPPSPDATQPTHTAAKPTAAAVKASGPAKTAGPAHAPAVTATPTVANPVVGAPAAAARPQPSHPAAAAPAPAPEPRLRSLAELPDEMRRSVPALAFGGSVYSEIATQRMVIFNGQVLREGDSLTDELLLEQIRPRSVVLRLRGQRFEVAF
jgi:general secretion pathway protein B